MKDSKKKRNLFILGVGVLSFIVLIAAASITLALLYILFNGKDFDAYVISFLALTAFAFLVTVVTVIFFYYFVQQSQTLVDSLNRVAEPRYAITIARRSEKFTKISTI